MIEWRFDSKMNIVADDDGFRVVIWNSIPGGCNSFIVAKCDTFEEAETVQKILVAVKNSIFDKEDVYNINSFRKIDFPKRCMRCGACYTEETFRKLHFVGIHYEDEPTEVYPHLILRNCECGSTHAVKLCPERESEDLRELFRLGLHKVE